MTSAWPPRLVIGGLNWGFIALFHVDLIAEICGRMEFGETNLLSRLIYSLIGVAAGFASYQFSRCEV